MLQAAIPFTACPLQFGQRKGAFYRGQFVIRPRVVIIMWILQHIYFFAIAYFSLESDNAQKSVGPTKDSVRCITLGSHNNWKVLLALGCFLELQINTFVD